MPKKPNKISSTWDALRTGKAFDILTGVSPQELASMVAQGDTPLPNSRPDLSTHALTAERLAGRIGALPTRVLGVGNEVLGGVVGLLSGEGFFGERGFDVRDLLANEVGIESAQFGNVPENPTRYNDTPPPAFEDGGRVGTLVLPGGQRYQIPEEEITPELMNSLQSFGRGASHPAELDPRQVGTGMGTAMSMGVPVGVGSGLDPLGITLEQLMLEQGSSPALAGTIGFLGGMMTPDPGDIERAAARKAFREALETSLVKKQLDDVEEKLLREGFEKFDKTVAQREVPELFEPHGTSIDMPGVKDTHAEDITEHLYRQFGDPDWGPWDIENAKLKRSPHLVQDVILDDNPSDNVHALYGRKGDYSTANLEERIDIGEITPEEIEEAKDYLKTVSQEQIRPYIGEDGKITAYRGITTREGMSGDTISLSLDERIANDFKKSETEGVVQVKIDPEDVLYYNGSFPGNAAYQFEKEVIVPNNRYELVTGVHKSKPNDWEDNWASKWINWDDARRKRFAGELHDLGFAKPYKVDQTQDWMTVDDAITSKKSRWIGDVKVDVETWRDGTTKAIHFQTRKQKKGYGEAGLTMVFNRDAMRLDTDVIHSDFSSKQAVKDVRMAAARLGEELQLPVTSGSGFLSAQGRLASQKAVGKGYLAPVKDTSRQGYLGGLLWTDEEMELAKDYVEGRMTEKEAAKVFSQEQFDELTRVSEPTGQTGYDTSSETGFNSLIDFLFDKIAGGDPKKFERGGRVPPRRRTNVILEMLKEELDNGKR